MQYDVEINGQLRKVAVTRRDDRFVVSLDDREWVVDAAQVGGYLLSLLIHGSNGSTAVLSREISIGADPGTGQFVFGVGTLPLPVGLNTRRRFGRKDDAGQGGAGPQRIVAPMPGRIVRVLGTPGDTVVRRQPVVVIEAMKMENELRAPRDGTLTDVFVREGQSVDAGALLAVITPA